MGFWFDALFEVGCCDVAAGEEFAVCCRIALTCAALEGLAEPNEVLAEAWVSVVVTVWPAVGFAAATDCDVAAE